MLNLWCLDRVTLIIHCRHRTDCQTVYSESPLLVMKVAISHGIFYSVVKTDGLNQPLLVSSLVNA